jgi:hypothetical protein
MPEYCWLPTHPILLPVLDGSAEVRTSYSWNARHSARNRCYLYRARPALHRATPVPASHLRASRVSPWRAKMDEIEEDVSKRVPRERTPPTRAAAGVDDDTDRADPDRESVETVLRQGMGRRFRKVDAVKRGGDGCGGAALGGETGFCGAARA